MIKGNVFLFKNNIMVTINVTIILCTDYFHKDALHKVNDALERFARLNPDLLPPIIKPVSDLVLRAAQMVQDFQKDLMEFYNVSICIYIRECTLYTLGRAVRT